jgi:hypothetical protein
MTTGGERLESVTQAAMLNGANAALLLKTNGEPEVIQFRDVTLNLDGSFTLSGLLRGRRGTDVFVDRHQPGELFVLLHPDDVETLTVPLGDLGLPRSWRAVGFGSLFEDAETVVRSHGGWDLLPLAPFHVTANLRYRFSASEGVHKAYAATPAANGDGVARWLNLGSAEDALQPVAARRPTYHTGGLWGRPYLACDRALVQHFADLAFTQPSGVTTLDPFTVFAVTDAVADLEQLPALLGSPASNGGKVSFWFRDPAGLQIHWVKSQIRSGDVANPQLLMAAAGRNAAGTTASPYARFWLPQNRTGVWEVRS